MGSSIAAQEITYPQQIKLRYEAVDPKGGHFTIWVDRDRIDHGLDPCLYPAVKYVEIIHVTPTQGSGPITMIEVGPVNSATPEFYHATGIIGFKMTGMAITVKQYTLKGGHHHFAGPTRSGPQTPVVFPYTSSWELSPPLALVSR